MRHRFDLLAMGGALRRLKFLAFLPLMGALGGCNAVVLHPSGYVAMQQRDLLLEASGLMLLIIVPVMVVTTLFAWRYRKSNESARYEPEWDHSTQLELLIWGAPLLIIICLGAMTWVGTHLLDPYRPVERISANRELSLNAKPLRVDVVSLNWKWLFIYPQYQTASLNELYAPVNRPIDFHITSATVMNSFFIPALAGQIYSMAGMETRLHAVMNKPGVYEGFSANYSGAGFSEMHFKFHALKTEADFDSWMSKVKASGGALTRAAYLQLAKPSINPPPQDFAQVDAGLFTAILNECVEPGQTCVSKMTEGSAAGVHGTSSRAAMTMTAPARAKMARRQASPAKTEQASAGTSAESAPKSSSISGAGLHPPPFESLFKGADNAAPSSSHKSNS